MVAVVRTGEEYQAEIPPLLTPEQQHVVLVRTATPRYTQRWGEPPASMADGDVEQFLAGLSHFSEVEMALQSLFASGFDLAAATDLLHAARRERIHEHERNAQRLSDDAFGAALGTHGKKFHLVKQALPGVESTREVVRKFYLWKASVGYTQWRERDRARKRKESTRALRRRWGDDSDSEAPSDYHNEYCDLCFTGGQLLCCDGCCRAFHFSCVTPPIKDVPKDDWFCAQCRALLGSDVPATRPSDENRFCGVVLIGGRSLTSAGSDSGAGNSSQRKLLVSGDSRPSSETGDNDSEAERRARGARALATLTDNDESDGEEQLDEGAASRTTTAVNRERAAAAKRQVDSSMDSSPSPSLLSASSSRKRQRKVDAPRRILLTAPSAAAQRLPPARMKTTPESLPSIQ